MTPITNRPAETATGAAGFLGYIILRVLGLHDEPDTLFALIGLLAATPSVVTWWVELRRRRDQEALSLIVAAAEKPKPKRAKKGETGHGEVYTVLAVLAALLLLVLLGVL